MDTLHVNRLAAARSGDSEAFSDLVEPYRYELRVHCYRMLGSLQDAEDLVQETFLRAWRRLDSFKENRFFRAWLYKIATNLCLDVLDKQRPKRILVEHQFPAADPTAPFSPPITEPIWLEPLPDEWLSHGTISPEAHYASRENISLAFLAALQHLPPRQRAVLILREVLDWNAREVAEQLELTVSAVNSLLHRARTIMNKHTLNKPALNPLTADEKVRLLLDQYVQAWESGDIETLISLLNEDTVLTMPPLPAWYRGHAAISGLFRKSGLFAGGHESYLLLPTRANNCFAFASYGRQKNGSAYEAVALHILEFDEGKLTHLTVFFIPSLFVHFSLPQTLNNVSFA